MSLCRRSSRPELKRAVVRVARRGGLSTTASLSGGLSLTTTDDPTGADRTRTYTRDGLAAS